MNKICFILLISTLYLCSCTKLKNSDSAIICCNIKGSVEKYIVLKNNNLTDTVFLNAKQQFKKSIVVKNFEYLYLKHGKNVINVFIRPGDSIFINGKSDAFYESLKFSGNRINENTYLLERKTLDMNSNSNSGFIQFEEDLFIKKVDSIYQGNLQFLKKFTDKNIAMDADFIKTEKSKLFYIRAGNMVEYETAYNTFLKKDHNELSKKFNEYLSHVSFNDSLMIDFFEYKSFCESYIDMKASQLTKDFEAVADLDFFTNKIKVLLQTVSDNKVKNYLLFDYFKSHIGIFGAIGIENLYTQFEKECTNKKYVDEIQTLLNKWRKIAQGNIASGFSLTDVNGKIHTLDECKGKYAYIDVWATWCAPCRREIPYIQKLYNEYKKEIVFISISIDESKDAWRKMIEIEKPEWLQLHAESGRIKLLDDYMISSIPRFIFIDKEGKIIDAQAPSASGDIRKLFDEFISLKRNI